MAEIPQHVRDKAADIYRRMDDGVKNARNDANLTHEGKVAKIANVYFPLEQQMNELKQRWSSDATEVVDASTKSIFGSVSVSGAEALSLRDAKQRVAQIADADEALLLMKSAELDGDSVLSRQIAMRAYETTKGSSLEGLWWSRVFDAYTEAHPEIATKVQALTAASRQGVDDSMDQGAVFLLIKPAELRNMYSWSRSQA